MKIYDIDELKFTVGFYSDLTQITFNYNPEVFNSSTGQYVIQRGEEMRMDLVCETIYQNVDNVDILCNYNNIDNPLNFKEGELISYPDESNIINLRYVDEDLLDTEITNQSPSKTTRKDPNRKEYNDNNRALSPTQLDRRISPLNTDSDQLSIGDGLF